MANNLPTKPHPQQIRGIAALCNHKPFHISLSLQPLPNWDGDYHGVNIARAISRCSGGRLLSEVEAEPKECDGPGASGSILVHGVILHTSKTTTEWSQRSWELQDNNCGRFRGPSTYALRDDIR